VQYLGRCGLNQSIEPFPLRSDRALVLLLLTIRTLAIKYMISTKDITRKTSVHEPTKNTLYSCPAAKRNISNHENHKKWSMPTAQTSNLESLPRPRLPSSLTRLVLPRAPPIILRNWGPLTVRVREAALRYQKTMARHSSCSYWSVTWLMSPRDVT
jgi:hypothetical protein